MGYLSLFVGLSASTTTDGANLNLELIPNKRPQNDGKLSCFFRSYEHYRLTRNDNSGKP
jgi:hypothetical protein